MRTVATRAKRAVRNRSTRGAEGVSSGMRRKPEPTRRPPDRKALDQPPLQLVRKDGRVRRRARHRRRRGQHRGGPAMRAPAPPPPGASPSAFVNPSPSRFTHTAHEPLPTRGAE
eukprot:15231453-Alexandrium_andersonii.AAC.1